MAKTYNKMLMDVNGKIGDIVTEVQGDQNSRYLDIYLFNNGIPINLTGHTVRIYMRRPNTNPLEEFFNDGEITEATRGRCQFLLSTQALAKVGELEAQVSIWRGTEEILSTQVFKIMVTTKLRTNGSIESSNEYGALVVLFQNLYEAYDLMTTMVQNIGNPSEIAAQYNLATMWQAWEFLTDYMKTDLTNKIDEAIANAAVQGVLDKIGTSANSENDTLFGNIKLVQDNTKYINERAKIYIPSDTVSRVLISNLDAMSIEGASSSTSTSNRVKLTENIVFEKDGVIKVTASITTKHSSSNTSSGCGLYALLNHSFDSDQMPNIIPDSIIDAINVPAFTIFQSSGNNFQINSFSVHGTETTYDLQCYLKVSRGTVLAFCVPVRKEYAKIYVHNITLWYEEMEV